MAIRTRKPIGRLRHARFGGGASGSAFEGTVSINLMGLEEVEKVIVGPRLEAIITPILEDILSRSNEIAPKRTGELVNSGFVEVESDSGKAKGAVGYTANHAAPVEFGAQGREPKPFLRPAWEEKVSSGEATKRMAEGVADLLSELDMGG